MRQRKKYSFNTKMLGAIKQFLKNSFMEICCETQKQGRKLVAKKVKAPRLLALKIQQFEQTNFLTRKLLKKLGFSIGFSKHRTKILALCIFFVSFQKRKN